MTTEGLRPESFEDWLSRQPTGPLASEVYYSRGAVETIIAAAGPMKPGSTIDTLGADLECTARYFHMKCAMEQFPSGAARIKKLTRLERALMGALKELAGDTGADPAAPPKLDDDVVFGLAAHVGGNPAAIVATARTAIAALAELRQWVNANRRELAQPDHSKPPIKRIAFYEGPALRWLCGEALPAVYDRHFREYSSGKSARATAFMQTALEPIGIAKAANSIISDRKRSGRP